MRTRTRPATSGSTKCATVRRIEEKNAIALQIARDAGDVEVEAKYRSLNDPCAVLGVCRGGKAGPCI